YLYCPFVSSDDKVVFLLFKFVGDFLMVTTLDFLEIKKSGAYEEVVKLNDKLKLVKLFQPDEEKQYIEMGFEVIKELFSYDNFVTYMDMICVSLENLIMNEKELKNISIGHLKHLDEEGNII